MTTTGSPGRRHRTDPRRRSDLGRAAVVWLVVLVLVVAGGGYAAYYNGYLDRFLCEGGTCSALDVLPPKGLKLPEARQPEPVLRAADGPRVSPYRVRKAVGRLLRDKDLGKHVGFAVRDLTHDEAVWSRGRRTFTPASTLKLFTSLAALKAVGPETRFATRVTRSGHRLVLVGGGDPYLATKQPKASEHAYPRRATLSTLARRTARALKRSGIDSVRLGYDDSLFTGPAVSPHWPADYVSSQVVTPVSALWVDQGVSQATGERSRTPARDAARAFADALRERGVAVRGTVRRHHEQDGQDAEARQVATVRSAPLAQIVQSLIEHSDNEAAEVVLRHTAIATGRPATFSGGVRAVRHTLTSMGVPWQDITMFDGSGLSRQDRVSLDSLLAVLQAADGKHRGGLLEDLPVAGFSGSLRDRFTGPGTDRGLGLVRAKTGTLTGVHGLAGVTIDADGTALAFAVLTDKVKVRDTLDAQATLDRVAAALAACKCGR